MDHDTNHILAMEIVDKREVDRKSVNMEKKGLLQALEHLVRAGLTVTEIVTDAHPQILAVIRK